jgi:hypothetical protein
VYEDGLPLHVPVVTARVCPCVVVPEITGIVEFIGANGNTDDVEDVTADTVPPAFVAVTVQVIVEPTSAVTRT